MARIVALASFMARQSLRLSVAAVGFTVLAAGIVMLVTPGPGLVVIIAGLAILAHQFAWAGRALDQVKVRAAQAREAALRRQRRQSGGSAPRRPPDNLPKTSG